MRVRTSGPTSHVVAVGFAVAVWSLTHTLTHLLIAGADDGLAGHLHDAFAGRLALGAAALTVVSAATVRRARGHRIGNVVGPAAFVGAEVLTHLGTLHAAPQLALLGVALVVHAVVGGVSQQLWAVSVGRRLLLGPPGSARPHGRPVRTALHRAWATRLTAGGAGVRGPPRLLPSPT